MVLIVPCVCGQEAKTKVARVPDSETAVRIAEPALIPVYGKKHFESERPFMAEL
jgi:hypothetical protein